MQKHSIRWIGIVVAITLVSSVLAYQTGLTSGAVSSSTVATLNQWAGLRDCTYQLFSTGSNYYYAQNCDSGAISFSGTNAATVVQSAIDAMTDGGLLFFKKGSYTFTSGVTITWQANKDYPVIGEGSNTILKFTGSGYLFTLSNGGGTTDPDRTFMMRDLQLTGVGKTAGRSGIHDNGVAGPAYFENLFLQELDKAIVVDDSNTRYFKNMRINQVNVGIETLAGDNSQPNAITVEGKNLMTWCTTACIDLSTDRETGNSVSLNNLVIDNSGIGVRMRGSGENIAVRDSYFEGNTIDIDVIGFDNTNNYEDVNLQPHGIN